MKASSRHLVDPALAGFLDGFPPLVLSMDNLADVRERARQPVPASSDAGATVETIERAAPGPIGAPDVGVLIHRPRGTGATLPCVFHIHGGGYVMGSPLADAPQHRALAKALSCCVVSVDYRLAPETPFPGAIEDCYAALSWLFAEAAALNIDPSRVGVMGESAGGGLAAALALMARDRGAFALTFQHLIYPMIDPIPTRVSSSGPPATTALAGRRCWAVNLAPPGSRPMPPRPGPATWRGCRRPSYQRGRWISSSTKTSTMPGA
jgi:triacylglycerol lipase